MAANRRCRCKHCEYYILRSDVTNPSCNTPLKGHILLSTAPTPGQVVPVHRRQAGGRALAAVLPATSGSGWLTVGLCCTTGAYASGILYMAATSETGGIAVQYGLRGLRVWRRSLHIVGASSCTCSNTRGRLVVRVGLPAARTRQRRQAGISQRARTTWGRYSASLERTGRLTQSGIKHRPESGQRTTMSRSAKNRCTPSLRRPRNMSSDMLPGRCLDSPVNPAYRR